MYQDINRDLCEFKVDGFNGFHARQVQNQEGTGKIIRQVIPRQMKRQIFARKPRKKK